MTRLVKLVEKKGEIFIRNVEELKDFIRSRKEKEDYFNQLVEKVVTKDSEQ